MKAAGGGTPELIGGANANLSSSRTYNERQPANRPRAMAVSEESLIWSADATLPAGRQSLRLLVIEDSEAGAAAGKAAGLEVLRVTSVESMPGQVRGRLYS